MYACSAVMSEVFLEEDDHGLVEGIDVAYGVFLCALPLVVEDLGGDVVVLESRAQNSIADVYVFAIHEECLIEESYLVEGRAADEHEGAADYLYGGDGVLIEILHVVASEDVALWEDGTEA